MGDKMKTLNRKQTRATIYNKPTKFIALNVVNAYIHPTKGYRGNKKAIAKYRAAMGYK